MRGHRSWGPRMAVVTMLAAAPVLWASGAHADPSATLVFTGGCSSEGAGPAATPVPERLSISEGGTLRLVNRLGEQATLLLDGEPAVELPPDGSVELVLHSGPVDATLRIACGDDDVAGTATIEVAEPAPATAPTGEATAAAGDQSPSPAAAESAPATSGPPSPAASTPAGEPAGEQSAGAGPVPASAGTGPGAPNAVLALVAAALVAGVLAAAIRTAAARRPARAEWT